jgi:hypothetical protein
MLRPQLKEAKDSNVCCSKLLLLMASSCCEEVHLFNIAQTHFITFSICERSVRYIVGPTIVKFKKLLTGYLYCIYVSVHNLPDIINNWILEPWDPEVHSFSEYVILNAIKSAEYDSTVTSFNWNTEKI